MSGAAKKVLVIGSGGREHALAWQVAKSSDVATVFVAPGNAGTDLESTMVNVAIAADDIDGLLEFATRERVDLTIVGPEAPGSAKIPALIAALGPSSRQDGKCMKRKGRQNAGRVVKLGDAGVRCRFGAGPCVTGEAIR